MGFLLFILKAPFIIDNQFVCFDFPTITTCALIVRPYWCELLAYHSWENVTARGCLALTKKPHIFCKGTCKYGKYKWDFQVRKLSSLI